MKKQTKLLIAVVAAAVLASLYSITAHANSLAGEIITDEDPVPYDVRVACDVWGTQYNICPELLEAIAFHESRYDATATNETCVGLMQINTASHQKRLARLGVDDLTDPYINVMVAADYLAELFAEHEDVGVVLSLYHGESNAVKRAQNGDLSSYVRKILELSAELERAHGK